MKIGEMDGAAWLPEEHVATAAGTTRELGARAGIALLAAVPLLVLFAAMMVITQGHFTYALDDPYIHLALARNIWLGHYGINLSEPSAPSSSIVWPFLLAPFSMVPAILEYVPLAINMVCLVALLVVVHRMFSDLSTRLRLAVAFVTVFSVNAYGLVFSGMEHNLQLLLVAVILLPYLRQSSGRSSETRLPAYAFVALAALPLVRYEGLALCLPLLLLAAWRGQRRAAAAVSGVIGVVVVGFSVFLHARGLGFLPSSIMAKTGYAGVETVAYNVCTNLFASRLLFAAAVVLVIHWWRCDRAWALVIVAVCVLHAMFGKHGVFGRYEAYFALFIALNLFRMCAANGRLGLAIAAMPFACLPMAICTVETPWASSNIYFQQEQTARIATMLDEPVAVNDLGLVSFRTHHYVLDLYGLGSITALRLYRRGASPAWMSDLMATEGVRYAFIYDDWFPKRPASWIRVGRMELTGYWATVGSRIVSLYAVDAASAAKLRGALVAWSAQDRSGGAVRVMLD